MTALAANAEIIRKELGFLTAPVYQNAHIYKGALVFAKASGGFAFSNDGTTNTLAAGDVFLGIAVEESDNSTGASGAIVVRYDTAGVFLLNFSDSLTQGNIGDNVFVNNVSDDSVVTITSDTGNPEAFVGNIVQYVSASTAYVDIRHGIGKAADTSPGDIDIPAGSVSTAKIADNAITQAKLADTVVGKAELKYEIKTVQITTGTSGTATVTSGAVVLGFATTAVTGSERVKTVAISGTTLTVTLTGSDTATVNVAVLNA